ncbi:MAG: PQQ-binding-like beta-propeller repeat protein, partial [Luteitalea sp.]|nr:PQQ-binding-like beta-propeller repeat protein [Luteitalea sp.]
MPTRPACFLSLCFLSLLLTSEMSGSCLTRDLSGSFSTPRRRMAVGMWESRVLCEISKRLWASFCDVHRRVISTAGFMPLPLWRPCCGCGLGTYSHLADLVAPAEGDIGSSMADKESPHAWAAFRDERIAALRRAGGRMIWQFNENEELTRLLLDDACDRGTRIAVLAITGALGMFASVLADSDPAAERFWPQWRGPEATGGSKQADPPIEWSETSNIRWKVEIPGRGSATPVIWGDRLFLVTAVPKDVSGADAHEPRGGVEPREVHRFTVMALDRRTGRVVWEQVAKEGAPHEGAHREHGTWASSSAVTDGERVFASFESHGLYAYDMDGKLLWQKDLGDKQMRNEFGEGSTPALYNNRLVQVWDHQGDSFIVTLDALTGKELWRRERDEIDS